MQIDAHLASNSNRNTPASHNTLNSCALNPRLVHHTNVVHYIRHNLSSDTPELPPDPRRTDRHDEKVHEGMVFHQIMDIVKPIHLILQPVQARDQTQVNANHATIEGQLTNSIPDEVLEHTAPVNRARTTGTPKARCVGVAASGVLAKARRVGVASSDVLAKARRLLELAPSVLRQTASPLTKNVSPLTKNVGKQSRWIPWHTAPDRGFIAHDSYSSNSTGKNEKDQPCDE